MQFTKQYWIKFLNTNDKHKRHIFFMTVITFFGISWRCLAMEMVKKIQNPYPSQCLKDDITRVPFDLLRLLGKRLNNKKNVLSDQKCHLKKLFPEITIYMCTFLGNEKNVSNFNFTCKEINELIKKNKEVLYEKFIKPKCVVDENWDDFKATKYVNKRGFIDALCKKYNLDLVQATTHVNKRIHREVVNDLGCCSVLDNIFNGEHYEIRLVEACARHYLSYEKIVKRINKATKPYAYIGAGIGGVFGIAFLILANTNSMLETLQFSVFLPVDLIVGFTLGRKFGKKILYARGLPIPIDWQ